jgi:glycosyltransferase involved in cell wall biosynthesis
MKITYIVPGFGNKFYCGNCLRDITLSKAIKNIGHDLTVVPMYLPNSIDNFSNNDNIPVFYGAVNIYLKQNYKLFRKIPKWLYSFLNSPFVLNYASRKSGSTRAEGLEEMTISMLKGEDGLQKEELDQLIYFLKNIGKPDVVHISNALLMGVAAKIKKEVNVPVICTLQDEDVWIDAMPDSYKLKLWNLMGKKAEDVDIFISVSHFFKNVMQKKMNIPTGKIHVVYPGIDSNLYNYNLPALNPPAIGYLSRLNEENGLGVLVEAFIKFKKNKGFENSKLILSGGKTSDDNKFINKQVKLLLKNNVNMDVEFIDDFRTSSLSAFLKKISILSVPVLRGEAFGLYQLEALASGIPTVQPELGAFPELADITNGGVTYSPNTSDALCEKWIEILSDVKRLNEMSVNGRKSVIEKFSLNKSVEKLVETYKLIKN